MGQVQIVRGWSVLIFCSSCLITRGLVGGGEAPEVEWTRVLPSDFVSGQDLGKTSDGGLILSGGALLKTDARGEPLWETSFEGAVWAGPSVRQLKDGHYILGGTFYGNGNPASVTGENVALIKVDPQGAILWQRAFGGEVKAVGNAVETTTDGGYAVTGGKASSLDDSSSLYLVRTDGEGNLLWEATYDSADSNEGGVGTSLQETADGGFIVTGSRSREGAILLKVDGQGNPLWEKRLSDGDVSLTAAGPVRVTGDGGYLLAGACWAGGGTESFLWRTDEEGNLIWRNRFPGPAGLCWLTSLDLTSDGGAVAAGAVQVLQPGQTFGEVDVYLVRVNQAGELLWEKRFLTPDRDHGLRVVQMPDGGYVVSTTATIDTIDPPGDRYASLIKLAPEGPLHEPLLRRGDAGGEGTVDLSDAILTLNYLFLAGPMPSCLDSSDADDDGEVSLTDGIVVLQFLFLGGTPPNSPGPHNCGPDPTADGLSCLSSGSCAGGRG